MPNVLIVVNQDTWKGIAGKEFLGIIPNLGMAKIGNFQVYVGGVVKDDIGPINADQ